MNDDSEHAGSPQIAQTDAPLQQVPDALRRRQFLRLAAAGAPLLLSVNNASAQAMHSAFACIDKDAQKQGVATLLDGANSDEWDRELIDVVEYGPEGSRVTGYRIGGVVYDTAGNPVVDPENVTVQGQAKALVYYQWDGENVTKVGVYPQAAGPQGLTVSCLASFPAGYSYAGRFLTGA